MVAVALADGYSTSLSVSAQYLIGSSATSFIYTVAGNGTGGYAGDGGPATGASLNSPSASAVDSAGNLYVADATNHVIRKVAAGSGTITTYAGTGIAGDSGDLGPATRAQINDPTSICVDSAGNLYIADANSQRIRMIKAATGIISTVAGNGTAGFSGDRGPAANAQIYEPEGLAMDPAGNLYIADSANERIRRVDVTSGIITTLAGNGYTGDLGDGGPATAASFSGPDGIALDSGGNLYIADTGNDVIRKVAAATGIITRVAGVYLRGDSTVSIPATGGYSGDGDPATSARFHLPRSVAFDSADNLYIADSFNQVIRKVDHGSGIVHNAAGNSHDTNCGPSAGDGGPASSASLCFPLSISIDRSNNLYVIDGSSNRVRIVPPAGPPPAAATAAPVVSVSAGTYSTPQVVTITDTTPGAAIYVTTDGAPATTAHLGYHGPIQITGAVTIGAVAAAPGHLTSASLQAAYVITSKPNNVIMTVAGTGVLGFNGAGGPAMSTPLGAVAAVAADKNGNLYFTDSDHSVVWEREAATGVISLVAGTGAAGYSGDGGLASSSQLNRPGGIAVDAASNVYIADTYNNVVRKVNASTGLMQIFAGTPTTIYPYGNGDGGPATNARLNFPQSLALDADGNLYIADTNNGTVRMVSAGSGIIHTVAGNGAPGFHGEGGVAVNASLPYPQSLAVDGEGNLFIGSQESGFVFKVTKATGILTVVAGNGNGYGSSGDGGPATAAEINPAGLALDAAGNLYIANSPGIVRRVAASTGVITTVVGDGYLGYSGDGGSAAVAELESPQGLAFDAPGNLYIADPGTYTIREVSAPAAAIAPTVGLTPSSSSITSAQELNVTVAVSGPEGGPTPTGSVGLSSSAYSAQQVLSNGAATFRLAAGALPPGHDTLTATFTPDAAGATAYTAATQTTGIMVNPAMGVALAIVTLAPSATTVTNKQTVSVAATVSGPVGLPGPTGNVTLTGGAYTASQLLSGGSAMFSVPASALNAGANSLMVSYSGDALYAATTGTTRVTVSPLVAAVSNSSLVVAGGEATDMVTFTAGGNYFGTLTLACALTSSPANAQNVPMCTLQPGTVTLTAGGSAASTLTITTGGAAPRAAMAWGEPVTVAFALLFGLPTWRRRKRLAAMVIWGVCVLGLIGCGGGGARSIPPPSVSLTTPGTYTFTVIGTDATNAQMVASATVKVIVQ